MDRESVIPERKVMSVQDAGGVTKGLGWGPEHQWEWPVVWGETCSL